MGGRKLRERTKIMVGMLDSFIACSPHKITGTPASCRILLTVWMSGWIIETEERYLVTLLSGRAHVRFSESALLGVVSIFNTLTSRSFLNFLERK